MGAFQCSQRFEFPVECVGPRIFGVSVKTRMSLLPSNTSQSITDSYKKPGQRAIVSNILTG